MKKIRIRKWTLGTLWAMLVASLTVMPAFADLIIPGQPRQPRPVPDPAPVAPDPAPVAPDPAPVTPDPAPVPAQPDTTLITVLIVGVAVIAIGVIAWVMIRRRRHIAA